MRSFEIISDRRRSQKALHDLSGRLLGAQEDERRRIARELHDDVSQKLALLSVDLDLLGSSPPAGANEIRERAAELADRVKDLSSDVHGFRTGSTLPSSSSWASPSRSRACATS